MIINRTLVYGLLKAVLAGLYTANMAIFERLFVAITGEQSERGRQPPQAGEAACLEWHGAHRP